MRTDEIKAYLRQYRESLGRSDELTAHLAELRDECDSLRDHEGQRVELDAAVAKYMDACREAAAELDRLADLREEIKSVIASVQDPRLREILRRRYINGQSFEQIADAMTYHRVHVCRLHGAALLAVQLPQKCC